MKWLRALSRRAFPEAAPEVDLHGLRVREALNALEAAIREAQARGERRLRIVCGKGLGSPGGVGVLREAVAGWLDARGYGGCYRRRVEPDGRDGSIWVELRPVRRPPVEEG